MYHLEMTEGRETSIAKQGYSTVEQNSSTMAKQKLGTNGAGGSIDAFC